MIVCSSPHLDSMAAVGEAACLRVSRELAGQVVIIARAASTAPIEGYLIAERSAAGAVHYYHLAEKARLYTERRAELAKQRESEGLDGTR